MKTWLPRGITSLYLLWIITNHADAGVCIDYSNYSYWMGSVALTGPVMAVVMEESRSGIAYVALGPDGFGAVDISELAAPALLDTLLVPGIAQAVALAPGVAWIAGGPSGLLAADVQSPENLRLISNHLTSGDAVDVAIRPPLAYVAAWDAGLEIVDISNPAAPRRVAGMDLPGFAAAIDLDSTYAYIADLIGISVIDISNPETPRLISSLPLSKKSADIAVQDDRAYIACRFAGVEIIDISNPFDPRQTGTYQPEFDDIRSLEVDPEHAYLIGSRLTITDLGDTLSELTRLPLDTSDGSGAIAAVGDLIAIGQSQRLDLVDFSNQPPILERISDSPGGFGELALDGDMAYVTSGFSLKVVDLSAPTMPTVRGQVHLDDFTFRIAASNGLAFVGIEQDFLSYGLQVIDVANPDMPAPLGTLPNLEVYDLAASGSFVYATGRRDGLAVVDASNPEMPAIRSVLEFLGSINRVALSGDYACVTAFNLGVSGMLVIDIANPDSLFIVGGYETGPSRDVQLIAVEGSQACLVEAEFHEEGLRHFLTLIDISNPESPVRTASISLPPGAAGDVEISGQVVYILHSTGLMVIDVRDPGVPRLVGGNSEVIRGGGVEPSGEYVFVTTGPEFLVLPAQCQDPQAVELAAFDAVAEPGAIRITWRTTMEEDHLGFHVERAMADVGPFARINRELIGPPGPYAHRDLDVRPAATYYYRLAALDRFGGIEHFGPRAATAIANDGASGAPLRSALARSQPNPFTPASTHTAIRFTLAHPGPTTLRLYDPAGRLIQTLVDEPLPAGEHLATWDGRNARGEAAAAGTYFYRLTAGDFTATHSLVRLR